ncbi:hypothetical protein P171DRAFT_489867 [Karstenula rhodostoma CBS 690.94]|uniref:HD domain-containing protein n=1 Tax=Karstenula rhodostoma CBS 690.94 TaxID=1392251 RepID=A0A9P4U7E7_9PLEO|nr:hypothetical protein P171DRAFT_489867 [Karstenula rhodostoma CBS 690.94]
MAPPTYHIPDAIKQLYQDPARHYHNLNHVAHVLSLIPDNHAHVTELIYATWFHDSVYDPRAPHGVNERESIKLWEKHVEEQGEELKHIKDFVSLMIQCTITHSLPDEPPADEALVGLIKRFLDMDMDVLAASRVGYLEYAGQVRREYKHLSDEEFRGGRAAFLESEIRKGKVFLLEENGEKNEVALGNMEAELGMLGM